jgi:hypothetical protein
VAYWLDRYHQSFLGPISELLVGDAKGVDQAARAWAEEKGIKCEVFLADWEGLGKKAGPARNERMVRARDPKASPGLAPGSCLAFPGPGSVGTLDCMVRATRAGWRVYNLPPMSPRSFDWHPTMRSQLLAREWRTEEPDDG